MVGGMISFVTASMEAMASATPAAPNSSSNYNSPVIDGCQKNFIIYISNGAGSNLAIVAMNAFPTDTPAEYDAIREVFASTNAAKAKGFATADVAKATGIAEAEANKARGLAEASVIEAQGKATAEAMRVKAESFKQYNEAAVIEMIVRILPEIAGKISEPLA